MSLTNPNKIVTEERLSEFYQGILPYLGGMPEMLANKFNKSDIYSTDEKMIGQWIDGKPIYQKTIATTVSSSAGVKQVALGITIDTFVDISGYVLSNNTYNPINCVTNDIKNIIKVYARTNSYSTTAERNTLQIYNTLDSFANKPITITIKYTKTTDSVVEIGVDTDYSTTEKIVGTWIDGKPLYQKTLSFQLTKNNQSSFVDGTYAHNITNANEIFISNAFAKWSDSAGTHASLPAVNIDNTSATMGCVVDTTYIHITTKIDRSSLWAYVTIQYTKTTD